MGVFPGNGKREMYSDNEIKRVVERIQKLPTLPEIGVEILRLAADPDVSMDDMSNVINRDPSLAARVLKVANSPFYGMPRQVDSLQLALVILGLEEVRNLALGITLLRVIKDLDTHVSYDRKKFWVHSTGCGIVARALGQKLEFCGQGTDFVAGLLHDIGKIIIDEYFGSKFVTIFNKTFVHKPAMLVAEREILGESHEMVGEWLAQKWGLPETFCEAIEHHHDFPLPESWPALKDPRIVALSYIAEAICDRYEIGWDGDSGYNDIKDMNAWNALLSRQDKYTENDIDTIIAETYKIFSETSLHLLE